MAKKIPITLLCGYLGAGKTTLLNKVLTNQKGYKVAVIVNDIGEVNVDERLISKEANITDTNSILPLTNGCICCTLKSDMVTGIENLMKTGKYDYVMIEASGVCEPMPIAQAIEQIEIGKLDNVVGVVDASRLVDEFGAGDALVNTYENKDAEDAEEDIESLLIQQIEFCSTLIINKKDLVTEDEFKAVRKVIEALHPGVKIIETDHGKVDVADVLATGSYDFETVYASAGWVKALEEHDEHMNDHDDDDDHDEHEHHHHHDHDHEGHDHLAEFGIDTYVYFARKPFDLGMFDEFVASHWPKNVIRCKGMCYFAEEYDMCYLFEQAGKQFNLRKAGEWFATMPKEELMQLMADDPQLRKDWDEQYGDRMQKLVFIGQHLDTKALKAALDNCLQ